MPGTSGKRVPGEKRFSEREKVAAAAEMPGNEVPQAAIDALEQHGEDVGAILDACRRVGMKEKMALALVERLAVQKAGFRNEPERMTTRDIIKGIEERIGLVMRYMDELAISQASPRDLALMFGTLIEKRQLLMGEPTQILSTQEREHIDKLVPELIEEAKRRGMVIDMAPSDYEEIGRETSTARVIQDREKPPQEKRSSKLLRRIRDRMD